jgi:putative ABC transport system permease protein
VFRYLPLTLKNSIRNRRRSILTIASIAVSLCLLGCLIAIYEALFYKDATPGQALRLVVRHHVSLAQVLPSSHEEKIARIPGVKTISVWNWFGGTYKDNRDPKNFFAQFGVEPGPFLSIRTQLQMPDNQRRAFISERTACVISRDLAEKLGLKVGDRVTLKSPIYGVNLDLYVRGVFDDPDALKTLFFNWEYLRQAMPLARREFVTTCSTTPRTRLKPNQSSSLHSVLFPSSAISSFSC